MFPSLKTPTRTYDGFEDIRKLYTVNIDNFGKFQQEDCVQIMRKNENGEIVIEKLPLPKETNTTEPSKDH